MNPAASIVPPLGRPRLPTGDSFRAIDDDPEFALFLEKLLVVASLPVLGRGANGSRLKDTILSGDLRESPPMGDLAL